jgi:spermidine synthase
MVYALTFILAFCSIVYELLLGQTLSAFLGNTVLRYSVTIGLYLLAMGIGALLAEGRRVRDPVLALLRIEVGLTLVGGLSVPFLHLLNAADAPVWLFSGAAHSLVIGIGVLTGMEIPLLIEIRKAYDENPEHSVIGIDYIGAFAGTVVFAFVFYPHVGLLATAFSVAALNAVVGLALITLAEQVRSELRFQYHALLGAQGTLFVLLVSGLGVVRHLDEFLTRRYLDIS